MNDRTNAYADQDIREYFLECGNDLFFRKLNPFPFGQCWGFNVHAASVADKFLHIRLHVKFLNQGAAYHGDHQADHHIDNCNFSTENAH